jgi:hypothetical protein
MVGARYVNEVKMEGEDGDYLLVDTSAGRDVRIRQHPFDIYFMLTSTTRFWTPMR